MNIFIAKLNFLTNSQDLREEFEQFGEVQSAIIITDREKGHSKGFGFIEMLNEDEAYAAINGLDGSEFDGNIFVVKRRRLDN